jgi:hypothetical protein
MYKPGQGKVMRTNLLVAIAIAIAIAIAAAGCGRASRKAAQVEEQAGASSVAPERSNQKPGDSASARIERAESLGGALAIARPEMRDTIDQSSPGAFLLIIWAIKAMKWADVDVAVNETSHAAVLRDSGSQRGLKLCVEGTVRATATDRFQFGEVQTGLMLTPNMEAYQFAAVGTPAKPGQKARFCGVTTGIVDYLNSKQERMHSVHLVGMFDPSDKRGG